jgi:hypothetical protein
VLCSYHYAKHTFHRERMLRTATNVLNCIDPVEKVRFSMQSTPLARPATVAPDTNEQESDEDA